MPLITVNGYCNNCGVTFVVERCRAEDTNLQPWPDFLDAMRKHRCAEGDSWEADVLALLAEIKDAEWPEIQRGIHLAWLESIKARARKLWKEMEA